MKYSANRKVDRNDLTMLQSELRVNLPEERRAEFVVVPHHPDRIRRPPVRLGAVTRDRFQQALTWNVFRTLELINPAFWLRRFHVRLTGAAPPPAAQMLRVSLWQPLPLPPIQRIDGGRPDTIADVVIETEHAVWTLEVAGHEANLTNGRDRVAELIDAGAWLAGARQHVHGIIENERTATSTGELWKRRYRRSTASVAIRSAARGPSSPTLDAFGALRWEGLAAVLQDCEQAHNLPAIERALAQNALVWLQQVGLGIPR